MTVLEQRLAVAYLEEQPDDAARTLELLPIEARARVLELAPLVAGPVLRAMTATTAGDTLAALPPDAAAAAVGPLPADAAVDLLRHVPAGAADRVIDRLPPDRRGVVRRMLRFPEGTAGALMDPDVLAVADTMSVREVRTRVRRSPRGLLYYLYVVDREHRLVGVIDMPELMRAEARVGLATVMHRPVDRLQAWMPAAAVRVHPGWRAFHAMPVVDNEDRLLGAIRYQTLRRLERDAEVAAAGSREVGATVLALGELFHLGLAGFVEGVVAVSGPRSGDARSTLPLVAEGESR